MGVVPMTGTIEAIYITAKRGAPLDAVDQVQAVPGQGLVGDRHAAAPGADRGKTDPGSQVTLIESETIEAAARDFDADFSQGRSRRNLVTRGVRLLELLDKEFAVGAVRLRGVRDCAPCGHLGKLTHCDAVAALEGRGGLRAEVISEGVIRVGDTISI